MKSVVLRKLKSNSGQSVILIAVVILSFLLFFSFAVNTGLLIAAKISVQSAADAAAYAGAATQARQLNAISFLNYDMRRQYKKFLYRYFVVGNVGGPKFPESPLNGIATVDGAGNYTFPKLNFKGSGNTSLDTGVPFALNVPTVCIPITTEGKKNDNCLFINLPDTQANLQKVLAGAVQSPITKALIDAINGIQLLQKNLCTGQGQINLYILLQWLFRGNVDETQLGNILMGLMQGSPLSDADKKSIITKISGLIEGLGLYPRNILTLARIQTLEKMLNNPPQAEVALGKVISWEKAKDADEHERTIQAFRSVLTNLNESVLDSNDVTMEELQATNQIALTPILIKFNAFVQMMLENQVSGGGTICQSSFFPFPALNVPVGVRRTNESIVHYAVRVKAKAKLLFLPIKGGLELEAVAGAKPFGSRIGPVDVSSDQLTKKITPAILPGGADPGCDQTIGCEFPNMLLTGTKTFFSADFLKELTTVAKNGTPSFGIVGLINAQSHAMAPYASEVGRYNVLPAPKTSTEMQYEFIPYANSENSKIYRFYAPLTTASNTQIQAYMEQFIDNIFVATQVGNNAFGFSMADLRTQIKTGMAVYLSNLNSGVKTDLGETETFAAVELPLPKGLKPSPFWLNDSNQVLSSWGPAHARVGPGAPTFKPRFGYSVKFVTLQNLKQAGTDFEDIDKVSH